MNFLHDDIAGAGGWTPEEPYVLRLYVTGMTPRSTLAIANLKRICEERIPGRYELKVIDVLRDPAAARAEQILAAPTLIKQLPSPLRRLIGDMSNEAKVLAGLGLAAAQV